MIQVTYETTGRRQSTGMPPLQSGIACCVWQWTSLIVLSTATLGCGGASHELETAPVSGTVTLDGVPLTSGFVFVIPSRGRGAKGAIQSDGTFVLGTYESADGVQVGTHSLTVSPIPLDEGESDPGGVVIPEKYSRGSSSQLTIEVKPGVDNQVELSLSSD